MNRLGEVLSEMLPHLLIDQQNWLQYFEHHPELQGMIERNQLTKDQILPAFNQLYQYIEEKKHCEMCKGLDNCQNLLKGHYTRLNFSYGQIQSSLTKCHYLIQHQEQIYKEKLFHSQYIAKDVLNASFKDLDKTVERQEVIKALLMFIANLQAGKKQKGIYLYGPLGVGKSHLMAATAKLLADKGISTLMIYVPDFFREIKNSIQDQSLHEKMKLLKEIEVLILDDIGAETISQWERDEILGAILQARMVKGLHTLYTSNLNYDDLEEHLSYSNKGGIEELKAKRIMERIRHYTVPYFLDGPNRRKEYVG
ncbi:primosomal protein DnaI [Tepidibacillus fermentans]|uniref:Replicative DNA helicase loader DnaI n=1 Tax=Tepidibacillus fermentans TaxID=1281767 RepID=A0A4R3KJR1_9BACI|nr:primosomal protein DnaI [Tepidibacillus fermentans]TCS83552.1 replicative DNA helicase loader DnaI [Tepidibacillus fermentans]